MKRGEQPFAGGMFSLHSLSLKPLQKCHILQRTTCQVSVVRECREHTQNVPTNKENLLARYHIGAIPLGSVNVHRHVPEGRWTPLVAIPRPSFRLGPGLDSTSPSSRMSSCACSLGSSSEGFERGPWNSSCRAVSWHRASCTTKYHCPFFPQTGL